jgi:hypothetical protein
LITIAMRQAASSTPSSSGVVFARDSALSREQCLGDNNHGPRRHLGVIEVHYSWYVPGELCLTGACRDSKDDKFLTCAVEGDAHYLLSSDKDLLSMRFYRGMAIVNPGQFLLALELHALDVQASRTPIT